MKVLVEKTRGNWVFWITHNNGIEIARSARPHRTMDKCITAAKKIATEFREGEVALTVDGETVPDVNQWGD